MYSDRLPYRSERDSDAYLRRSKVRRDDSSRSASPRKSKVGREEYYYDHQEASRATQEHRQETNRYSRTSHPPSDRRSSKDDKWRSSKDDRVDEFGRRGDRSTSRTPSHDERETHHRKGDNWRSSKDDNWRPSKDDRVDEYGRRGDRSTGRAHPHDERETHHRKDDNWRSSKVDWRSSKDDRVDKYRRRGERSTGRAPPRDERETHHRRYNDKNLKEYSEQRRRWEDDDARGREPVERNYHYGTSKPSREPRHRPHRSLSEQRRDLGIVSVVPDVDIAPIKRFSDEHSIPEYALDALRRHEKLAPYPIQAQVIPLAARGMNITGIARTGSGKTLAFLLPGLRYCTMPECRTVAALCMNPTRELAQQTYVEMNLLTASEEKSYNYRTKEYVPKSHVFKSAVMYGGIKKDDQRWDAQGCRFIAATPGRLLDFLREDDPCVDLSRLKYFVLDEADMMINVGFGPEIKSVCDFFEDSRPQVLFFSATWPQSIVESARNMMNDVAKPGVPIMVSMGADETPTVTKITLPRSKILMSLHEGVVGVSESRTCGTCGGKKKTMSRTYAAVGELGLADKSDGMSKKRKRCDESAMDDDGSLSSALSKGECECGVTFLLTGSPFNGMSMKSPPSRDCDRARALAQSWCNRGGRSHLPELSSGGRSLTPPSTLSPRDHARLSPVGGMEVTSKPKPLMVVTSIMGVTNLSPPPQPPAHAHHSGTLNDEGHARPPSGPPAEQPVQHEDSVRYTNTTQFPIPHPISLISHTSHNTSNSQFPHHQHPNHPFTPCFGTPSLFDSDVEKDGASRTMSLGNVDDAMDGSGGNNNPDETMDDDDDDDDHRSGGRVNKSEGGLGPIIGRHKSGLLGENTCGALSGENACGALTDPTTTTEIQQRVLSTFTESKRAIPKEDQGIVAVVPLDTPATPTEEKRAAEDQGIIAIPSADTSNGMDISTTEEEGSVVVIEESMISPPRKSQEERLKSVFGPTGVPRAPKGGYNDHRFSPSGSPLHKRKYNGFFVEEAQGNDEAQRSAIRVMGQKKHMLAGTHPEPMDFGPVTCEPMIWGDGSRPTSCEDDSRRHGARTAERTENDGNQEQQQQQQPGTSRARRGLVRAGDDSNPFRAAIHLSNPFEDIRSPLTSIHAPNVHE